MKTTNICRCCLSNDCHKDISTVYFSMGKKEVYEKMLNDTFDVIISQYGDKKRMICEKCIMMLKSATAFKKQVLHAEKTFRKRISAIKDGISNKVEPDTKLKSENDMTDDDNWDFSDTISEDCLIIDDDINWKIEENDSRKEEEGKIFVIKLEPNDDLEEKTKVNMNRRSKTSNVNNIKIKTMEAKRTVKKRLCKSLNAKPSKDSSGMKKISNTKLTSPGQKNRRRNTIKLILNSNMCLFTSYKTKYGCYVCKEKFLDIKDLREHSKTHSNDKYLESRVNQLRGLSCKNAEISSLTCKLCSESCQEISDLQTHLTNAHKFEFVSNEHLLTPYRLEDGFKCVICRQNFNHFLSLSIHMNTHSTNNVCEVCGVSYINRLSLRMHIQQVHTEKKCKLCSAVFTTNSLKAKHMKKAHNIGPCYKRHCVRCGKTFQYTYQLQEHNVKEHGAKRQISVCGECGKSFPSPYNLRTHTRAVHIRERNYPCRVCDMRFFTKYDMRRHEGSHADIRMFSCSYCEGKFKSKDSWRRHFKRQHARLYAGGLARGVDVISKTTSSGA